jgi:hypothetical protein
MIRYWSFVRPAVAPWWSWTGCREQVMGKLSTQGSALRTASLTVIDKCGQATKGVWWMSWHREAMKDAAACDKLRGVGKRTSIRRFLNAETRRNDLPSLPAECIGRLEQTWGTETSKYPQEKKKTLIPSVAASESGRAQTGIRPGVAGALS